MTFYVHWVHTGFVPVSDVHGLLNSWGACADPERGTGGQDTPPGKSQGAFGILRNTGMEPPRKTKGPMGSNCFS